RISHDTRGLTDRPLRPLGLPRHVQCARLRRRLAPRELVRHPQGHRRLLLRLLPLRPDQRRLRRAASLAASPPPRPGRRQPLPADRDGPRRDARRQLGGAGTPCVQREESRRRRLRAGAERNPRLVPRPPLPAPLIRYPPNHSASGSVAASAEKSPSSRIATAASAIALTATQVRLPPTLTRCAPASTIWANESPGTASTFTGSVTASQTARISSASRRPG